MEATSKAIGGGAVWAWAAGAAAGGGAVWAWAAGAAAGGEAVWPTAADAATSEISAVQAAVRNDEQVRILLLNSFGR
jgi:outer membrane lipoprotein SlyB